MESVGFPLEDVTFSSDRGYKSMDNTQCLIDKHSNFVQALSINEDSVKHLIRKYPDRLTDLFKTDDVYDIVGFTPTAEEDQEIWRRKDQTYVRVYIHLFFNEAVHDHEIKQLRHDVAKVLELKRKGKTVDPELLQRTSRFLVKREKETEGGKKQVFCGKDESAMRSATEFAGYFGIRTNLVMSPMQSFEIYRDRAVIESSFREMKALNDCNRM